MKPPVETVRISSKGKDILITLKRKTGVEHWNELGRMALCRSLANPTKPSIPARGWDSAIEIEWKTFAGEASSLLSALATLKGLEHGVAIEDPNQLALYFRSHLERGVASLKGVRDLHEFVAGSD